MSLLGSYWSDIDNVVSNKSEFVDHPYTFRLFASFLGILMVFRTNCAYNRYWEGIGMVQAMAAKWADGCCMGIAFDAPGRNDTPLLCGAHESCSCNPHPKSG